MIIVKECPLSSLSFRLNKSMLAITHNVQQIILQLHSQECKNLQIARWRRTFKQISVEIHGECSMI